MKFFKKYTLCIKILSLLCAASMLFGCVSDSVSEITRPIFAPTEEQTPPSDTLNIAVSAEVLTDVTPLLNLYSALEGVEVSITEIPYGSDVEGFISTLTTGGSGLVISDNIYNVNTLSDRGGIMQIRELESALLASFATHVPDYLESGDDVAFLPVGIDGYGYLCNTTLLAELLLVEDVTKLADDIRRASAAQWREAVSLLDDLITGENEEGEILRLSSGEYTLPDEMPESIENLVAPYALNLADSSVLLSPLSVILNATPSDEEDAPGIFEDYPEFILNELEKSATPDGRLQRTENPTEDYADLNYATSVALYEQDKVLFLRSSLSEAFTHLSQEALSETVVFPLRPFVSSDDTEAYTLNAAMTVTTPFVFALPENAPDEQNEAAMDFLVWFYYSETGRAYITDTLGLLEFNRPIAENPLSVQLFDYIDNSNVAADMLLYTNPKTLLAVEGTLYNDYLSFEEWDEETMDELTATLEEAFNPQ